MNKYVEAIEARYAAAVAKNATKRNLDKLMSIRTMLLNNEFAAMLEDAKVDAERISRAIYANEKVFKFAHQAIKFDAKSLNENTYAVFRTAINCFRHNVVLTKHMIEASLSRSIEVSEDIKHLVYQRSVILDDTTIAAQSQTSRDALETLNIITQRADNKQAYDVKLTKLARALCKAFNVECTKVEK